MEERKAVIDRSVTEWGKVFQGKEYNKERIIEFYHHLAMDVQREKKRIGGDFVIATILMSADIREKMRSAMIISVINAIVLINVIVLAAKQ